jgi:hypothetical protein
MKNKMKPLYKLIFLLFSIQIAFSQTESAKEIYKFKITVYKSVNIEIETPYNDDYLYALPPYPMPAKEYVNSLINWDKRYDFNKAEINVFNTEGTKICDKDRISISQQSDWSRIITWNASGFPYGIYIILIKHGSKTISVKVAIG